ncbi:MAG TPA: hypothetical protein VK327_10590 [Candidatus Paceibacterota bacterium]|nr:hypothetical protein [Candidatus Paceibacterota bacterium]
MNETEHSDSFVLKIDYEKDSLRPSRVFRAMSEMIEGFQSLDNNLVQAFPVRVSPVLLLEDIQVGSLRTVMKNVLTGIEDEALKNLEWKKMIGGFLVQGKHAVLHWIERREQIESRKALDELAQNLLQLAEGTKVLHLPHYSPPPLPLLIKDLAMIGNATSQLGPNDVATYESEGTISEFNKKFHVDAEFAEELLTDETISNRSEVLLRVKKPDYLGESMWEFVHAGHVIRAKIEDHDWLVQFQFQRVEVMPGDALRVQLETTTHHGSDGSEIMTYYRISKVIGVKRATGGTQLELPPSA